MAKILVAYYSRSGETEKLAKAVAEGVTDAGGKADLKKIGEIDVRELPSYDGIILGSPVYFGTMTAEVKKFIDDAVVVRRQLTDKIGAAFTTSGHRTGGKETTLLSILQAMLIAGMIVVGDPIETGGHYGAAGSDPTGLREGKALGERVTRLADRLRQ